uniref:chloroplast enveloppe membrane protein n=1 Tax=Polulichloris maxima TaxID=2704661 RepID=UPI0024110E18|nr:chloroplast enveloppe membrane protein [Polulichloris maxima]WDY13274.1 chloroplast enveloppe membrane protein [Polulichloris maxima]
MEKQAFEPTGLIPRSIIRTVDRFVQQLLPGREKIALQEYRVSRYQILVSIKSLLTLILIPLLVSSTIKVLFFTPIVEHFWNNNQSEIFLNQYQEKRAFSEMHDFSEKMFFESLLTEPRPQQNFVLLKQNMEDFSLVAKSPSQRLSSLHLPVHRRAAEVHPEGLECTESFAPSAHLRKTSPACFSTTKQSKVKPTFLSVHSFLGTYVPNFDLLKQNVEEFAPKVHFQSFHSSHTPPECTEGGKPLARACFAKPYFVNFENERYQRLFQRKSLELAKSYNKQSILAITNLLGDFLTFFTVSLLFRIMRPELIILKSFLTESVYSLSDTTKSFLLILGMDLLVGFHSPRGWELLLEGFLRHIGLPENENFILLFVALFPVFLDTVFKYWIFRYLNKISPSTVVTYHSMIE